MTDTLEIKKIIRMKGFTLDTLSKKIGISRTSLSYKINNIVEFNAQEIKHIQKILENGGILNGEEFEIMLKEEAEERRDSKLEEINQNIIQLNKTMYEILKIISNNQ